jgi:hypothetical protein
MRSHIIQHDYIHPCGKTKGKATSFTEIWHYSQNWFRKMQQIAQPTDKGISSQSGGKRLKLPRPAPFKI